MKFNLFGLLRRRSGTNAAAFDFPPLINTTGGTYNGISLTLGETTQHYNQRPALNKLNNKKILVVVIGASTHGQQAAALEILANPQLNNVQILNCCASGHDVNKWLNLTSLGWAQLKQRVANAGYELSEVQAVLFGHDDLQDGNDVRFPQAPQNLSLKVRQFIQLAKTQFPNLKQVDLISRLCEYQLSARFSKYFAPSGYHTGYANKFLVESVISTGNMLDGIWVTDATAYVWTNGETPNSGTINGIGNTFFQFRFSWMKPNNIHLNTRKQGDEVIAGYILTNYKRYAWVN